MRLWPRASAVLAGCATLTSAQNDPRHAARDIKSVQSYASNQETYWIHVESIPASMAAPIPTTFQTSQSSQADPVSTVLEVDSVAPTKRSAAPGILQSGLAKAFVGLLKDLPGKLTDKSKHKVAIGPRGHEIHSMDRACNGFEKLIFTCWTPLPPWTHLKTKTVFAPAAPVHTQTVVEKNPAYFASTPTPVVAETQVIVVTASPSTPSAAPVEQVAKTMTVTKEATVTYKCSKTTPTTNAVGKRELAEDCAAVSE